MNILDKYGHIIPEVPDHHYRDCIFLWKRGANWTDLLGLDRAEVAKRAAAARADEEKKAEKPDEGEVISSPAFKAWASSDARVISVTEKAKKAKEAGDEKALAGLKDEASRLLRKMAKEFVKAGKAA